MRPPNAGLKEAATGLAAKGNVCGLTSSCVFPIDWRHGPDRVHF